MIKMRQARELLGYNQYKMAWALGLSLRMISYIENGKKPLQQQTELAIECLLRRAGKYKASREALK